MGCLHLGIYYKIKDGLTVKLRTFGFYCDLLSIIPYELFYPNWLSPIFRMVLKVWKVLLIKTRIAMIFETVQLLVKKILLFICSRLFVFGSS